MPAATRSTRLAVKLDPATHDKLQALADRNHRTITGQIRALLEPEPRHPIYVFRFDDWQVTAFQSKYRFFVTVPLALKKGDGEKFCSALERLAADTGWQQWSGRNDTILNAIHLDCEYAHIFVAMNLPRLHDYANDKWTSWLKPGFCIQYAMIHGANGADYLYGNEVLRER